MRLRVVLLLAIAILGATVGLPVAAAAEDCGTPAHAGGEWRTYGQDHLNHRNQAAETKIGVSTVGNLKVAWVFPFASAGGAGTIESTAMVADGCLYVGTQAGWVFALNADTGALDWRVKLSHAVTTLAVANGRVFATVSRPSNPFMVALDQDSGIQLWETTLTTMQGSDVTGSPVAWSDMVATGVSCIGAEGSSGAARRACRGAFVILDQSTGELLRTAYGISDEDFAEGHAGGAMWSAPGIDVEDGYAYMGAGNPFTARDHPRTNALLKIDINPTRSTFGTVVDSYKATPEQYLPLLGANKPACAATNDNFLVCEQPDLDMAMAPTIYHDNHGRKVVGAGQGSGIWHTVYADTMEYAWSAVTGGPFIGHRGGGAAYDGTTLYTAGGSPGIVWALDKSFGDARWVRPVLGPNSFNPTTYANGVVYTLTGGGRIPFLGAAPVAPQLLAFDAKTGDVVLSRPFTPDIGAVATGTQASGVTVARNKVYAPVNAVGGSYLVAYTL